jgi:hypothetical protein
MLIVAYPNSGGSNLGNVWFRTFAQNSAGGTLPNFQRLAKVEDIPTSISSLAISGDISNDAEIVAAYNAMGAFSISSYRMDTTVSDSFAGIKVISGIQGLVTVKKREYGFFAEIELFRGHNQDYLNSALRNRSMKFFRSYWNFQGWLDPNWIEIPQNALVIDEEVDLNTMYSKYANGTFLITGESGIIRNSPLERWFVIEQSVFTRGDKVRILQKLYKDNDVSQAWTRIGEGTWHGEITWTEASTGGNFLPLAGGTMDEAAQIKFDDGSGYHPAIRLINGDLSMTNSSPANTGRFTVKPGEAIMYGSVGGAYGTPYKESRITADGDSLTFKSPDINGKSGLLAVDADGKVIRGDNYLGEIMSTDSVVTIPVKSSLIRWAVNGDGQTLKLPANLYAEGDVVTVRISRGSPSDKCKITSSYNDVAIMVDICLTATCSQPVVAVFVKNSTTFELSHVYQVNI